MENKIDRAIRTMFLRRKLQFIEAQRAERSRGSKLKTCLARLRYPRTDRGRRRFIQDSLNPDNRNRNRNKYCYLILTILSLAGIVLIALNVFRLQDISSIGMILMYSAFCLCLIGLIKGIQGIFNREAKQ